MLPHSAQKYKPDDSKTELTKTQSEPVQQQSEAAQYAAIQQPSAPELIVNSRASVNASYVATEAAKWYPPLSRKYEEEGTVLLRVNVLTTGRCLEVEIKKSSNYPMLDEAAVALAKSLTYHPAVVNGTPVSDWMDFPVVFKLRSRYQ